jgi:hypothetical protein
MRLFAHYFEPADFMLEQFLKLERQAKTPRGLSHSKHMERRYYLMFWLSSLYVVLEGMEKMPLVKELENRPLDIPRLVTKTQDILTDFDNEKNALRLLRNAQSHYQTTAAKHLQFFDTKIRIDWAKNLHSKIKRLLSDYRVQTTIICAFSGRKDEIDIKRRPDHPYRHLTYS